MTSLRSRRTMFAAMMGAGALIAAAGCSAGPGTGTGPEGDGVAFGASIEEYRAAFADIEPISIKFQVSGPAGDPANVAKEAYRDAVEEWSDGKITFEMGYSNAFVPNALEWANGLADGRIDLVYFVPYLAPEVFPALSDLASASFLDGNQPTSTLVSSAWLTEVTHSLPIYQEEAAASGVHLLPAPPTFNVSGYFCADPITSLSGFEGLQVAAAGRGQFAQLEALGATPVSMSFTELYEGLQRGVIDCVANAQSALATLGAVEMVPNLTADPDSGLSNSLVLTAFSKDTWESLPLVAQQLLYDRIDVLLRAEPAAQSVRNVEWVETVLAAGGGVTELSDDARAVLADANAQLLDELDGRGVDTDAFLAARDRWFDIVNRELYPDLPASLETFLVEGGYTDVDLTPFTDALYERVLEEHRPG